MEADTHGATWPVTVDPLLTTPAASLAETQTDAAFGATLANAGDVDGNGYPELLVGAPGWDGEAVDEGRVYLFAVGPTGIDTTAAWTADPTDQAGAAFGSALAGPGDLDEDGFGDVAVGAPGYDAEAGGEGRVYVYRGSSAGASSLAGWTFDPADLDSAAFGTALAGVGDVAGDGSRDLLVGAPGGGTASGEGAVYLYGGGAGGPAWAWTEEPTNQVGASFGQALAGLGDLDGDGIGELAAGAPDWDGGSAGDGQVRVYQGAAGGPVALWSLDPRDTASTAFGAALAGGDFDGDGIGDLAVGSPGSALQLGHVSVYAGAAGTLGTTAAWEADTEAGDDGGAALATGDFNADGFTDLAAGAPEAEDEALGEGRIYTWFGTADGLGDTALEIDAGDGGDAAAGSALAALDVTGDGFLDLAAGLPGAESVAIYAGYAEGLASAYAIRTYPISQGESGFGYAFDPRASTP